MTSCMVNASLGSRIRSARKDAGISPEALAVDLGVSAATIFRIERDATDVSVKRLGRIAEVTGKPISYFIGQAA